MKIVSYCTFHDKKYSVIENMSIDIMRDFQQIHISYEIQRQENISI